MRPKLYTFELMTKAPEECRAKMASSFPARVVSFRVIEPQFGFYGHKEPRVSIPRKTFVTIQGERGAYEAAQFIRSFTGFRGEMLHRGQAI